MAWLVTLAAADSRSPIVTGSLSGPCQRICQGTCHPLQGGGEASRNGRIADMRAPPATTTKRPSQSDCEGLLHARNLSSAVYSDEGLVVGRLEVPLPDESERGVGSLVADG